MGRGCVERSLQPLPISDVVLADVSEQPSISAHTHLHIWLIYDISQKNTLERRILRKLRLFILEQQGN